MNSYSDPGQHVFWILSRASGVVALILAAVSVGMGLAMAMRAAKGPGVKGGPKKTRTSYFYSGSFHPFGATWGGKFAGPSPAPE